MTAVSTPTPATLPECNVVMKGGITSGVIYPRALATFAEHYRIRDLGGASAGAIGAALGAAAEFARTTGGYARLRALPDDLGDGRLAALFQPQPSTKPLLRLLLTATGHDRPGVQRTGAARLVAVLGALLTGLPVPSLLGGLPGVIVLVLGIVLGSVATVLLGALLAVVGWVIAIAVALNGLISRAVPENMFGICTGLSQTGAPGFTDWLSASIDDIAGLAPEQRPLRIGQLWTGSPIPQDVPADDRVIDLRMISTCLSQSRPYEMPWGVRTFFYDPAEWAKLFPAPVMDALNNAPRPRALDMDQDEWEWEANQAAAHTPPLLRLPDAPYLPVIVITRLSLSFPVLISAIPLWTIDRRAETSKVTQAAYRQAVAAGSPAPSGGLEFTKLWFTDGGLCSNFPVQLFDAVLPTRPTFAINLGSFSANESPSADQRENVDWATTNSSGLLPPLTAVPATGWPAVAGFTRAAFATAREWNDSTQLTLPGFRERIVRVKQTKQEGGLNLFMDTPTIENLAERGATAASVLVDQFTQPHFAHDSTGWDNHRWVRYRALLACLPSWLDGIRRGRAAMADLDPASPPSYALSVRGRHLATQLDASLGQAAGDLAAAPDATADLTSAPRPQGVIRRVPAI